jgi:hypothetical protein
VALAALVMMPPPGVDKPLVQLITLVVAEVMELLVVLVVLVAVLLVLLVLVRQELLEQQILVVAVEEPILRLLATADQE